MPAAKAEPAPENPGGHPSLAAALVAFQAEIPKVPKNSTAVIPGKNGGQGYRYSYADLPDVSDAATPALTRHGIAFVCLPRMTTSGGYELTGTLVHALGETMEGSLPLTGRQAQEIGSSITYARRYLLGCMTGIVTDDDDDGSIAAANAERLTAPEPYYGPSTSEYLGMIDDLAKEAGVTYADVTAKWRKEHGDLTVDALDDQDPRAVGALYETIRSYVEHLRAEGKLPQQAPA